MKFTISRTAFTKALNIVSRAISTKTTIPILTGLKLQAAQSGLILTGSDADISIETTLKSDDPDNLLAVQSEGAIVLPARFFTDIVKKLPEETLTIEVGENFQTMITSGQSSFTINGLDANNYPHLPEIETTNSIPLAGDLLKQIISQTVIAVSNQESRPILTGVHFILSENNFLAVATDSHRLSQRKVTLEKPIDGTFDFVIPGKSLTELSRMIDDNKEDIVLSVTENQALFTIGETLFYSRLLEGNYPDTSRLIPNSHDTRIAFDAPELLASIERASLLSHESRNNVVKITVKPETKTVTIYGNSPDVGNVEEDLEPKTVEGNELEISFNPDYMKDALRSFSQATINLDFTSSLRPFTLTPTEDSESFVQLITPIRTF
ncbi:DNA polymerase III subunit beta [Lentilactobacillus farraginis]|uniref:Beta sliding clamp n=1 Tax=Lentilactobacillus farraginis DSM 18382 = JCM 14108 TaxID=1423743 RepID=X0QDZ4_9LACO|nr:DNA polymerase III subunit beta [Lentilactobacillus farraginis]KRM09847.1 DNA-directed DNA polymerase [Lentilactobacillus farraginis DSM 18382 = JCM 14108]GAF36845.1 DNA polymerase III beta subunit [Lentilactobacillus farraginis DSM 18382 = JCM 14108]